jgi:hypothetical protein
MNILVPLNNIEFLKDYINAGAGEFYMGFYDDGIKTLEIIQILIECRAMAKEQTVCQLMRFLK